MNNIIVRRIPLPPKVNAMTSADPEGDYNVYINLDIPESRQKTAFFHEISHITKSHFYSSVSVSACENGTSTAPIEPSVAGELIFC